MRGFAVESNFNDIISSIDFRIGIVFDEEWNDIIIDFVLYFT